MKRSLSGIKPSGILHLGNYFGAMKQFIESQNEYEGFYFIADYHTLNTHPAPEEVRQNTYDIVLDYLALGLDPQKATIFLQSEIPEVAELTCLLANVVPISLLQRAHAYKDQIAKDEVPNLGLFMYPALMAIDILIYDSDVVPVGKDQKQHIEMTRDMAERFNSIYGEVFKLPEPRIIESLAVVPGTDGRKMSKSYGNTIEMFASEKALKKQVMGIQTDSTPLQEPKETEGCNVFTLYKLFSTKAEQEEMKANYHAGGYGYGNAKQALLEKIHAYFKEAREKRVALQNDMDYVKRVLKDGSEKARAIAIEKTKAVKHAVGLVGNVY